MKYKDLNQAMMGKFDCEINRKADGSIPLFEEINGILPYIACFDGIVQNDEAALIIPAGERQGIVLMGLEKYAKEKGWIE